MSFLALYSTSLNVARDYFNCYYVDCDDFNDPLRSEKDVSLATINAAMSEGDATLHKDLLRCESTDRTFLMKPGTYTLPELKREIDDLKSILLSNNVAIQFVSTILKTGKKEVLVENVVKAIKKLNSVNPLWGEARKAQLTARRQIERDQQMTHLDDRMNSEIELIQFSDTNARTNIECIPQRSINVARYRNSL